MRPTSTVVIVLLLAFSAAYAQSNQSPSELPQNPLFTSDLIVWTETQNPQPVPTSPPQQERSAQPTPANPSVASGLQTFSGVIKKEGNTYVLRTADKWYYDLDDQETAAQYENRQVTVKGKLNLSGDLIRIHDIAPAS
jgi:hypothetical protein